MLDLEKLSHKKRFKWLSEEEVSYLEEHFPWTDSKQEAVWCLKNNIFERPICKYKSCNEYAKFRQRIGYTGCCKTHNTKITNLEKYGVENVKQNKNFIEKAKKTYQSKSIEEKKEIQKRKEQSMMKKYGVINPSYSDEIKNKISEKNKANAGTRMKQLKKNNQKKYGVDNVFQLESVKEKSKDSIMNKFGVENPSQSDEIKIKKEETCLKHFGVKSQNQDPIIHEKQQKYRWKDYTMPSGAVVKIQGYENFALDILLETYNEDELVIDRKMIPKVWYDKPDSKNKHQYTTDIFIPKENKFIEVKSPYTYEKYLDINLMKKQASIDAGFTFEFMILDVSGNIIQS